MKLVLTILSTENRNHGTLTTAVLDDMRAKFREHDVYFCDTLEDPTNYLDENIFGVPTERETSVLERGLPCYRALFTRASTTI